MSCAFSSSLKRKEKEIQKKKSIKLRKIDKRKREILVSKAFHNIYLPFFDSFYFDWFNFFFSLLPYLFLILYYSADIYYQMNSH